MKDKISDMDINELTDIEKKIVEIVNSKLGAETKSINVIGTGAVGKVYKLVIDKEPYNVAIKFAENRYLMDEEVKNIEFIRSKIDIKLPKVYFTYKDNETEDFNIICMQVFDGVSAGSINYTWKSNSSKIKLANQIVDNLLKLHSVKNDKFGAIDGEQFEDWFEYYKTFSENILKFAEKVKTEGKLSVYVYDTLKSAYNNYDKIFDEPIGEPTLMHGDYWVPNLIVDKKTLDLIGVVDPFNVQWADRDYDLFPLVVGAGIKLKLYEIYKEKAHISDKCDLKNEYYALFSEMYWYSIKGSISHNFLKYKSKLLRKQMKRFGLI